jgi:lipoprotein-anchoring transpeptidase ErfK/SrfK
MRYSLHFLTLAFIILSAALITQPRWPQWFSHQDQIDPAQILQTSSVLGDQIDTTSTKRIEVNLTTQQLFAYENNQLIHQFTISSGKWNRTPTGTFYIWAKVPKQKMSGGSKELGTYYYLPNVPYVLFFYNDKVPKKLGYSLHGTYWHKNFGVPMSHGCINLKTPDAATLFTWADGFTPIVIYGKYQGKATALAQ